MNLPPRRDAEITARRLARYGVNMVRIHQADAGYAGNNLFRKGRAHNRTRSLDPDMMDRLDYLIAQLKANGIYVYFGNGGPGVGLRPRQRQPDDSPLAWLGQSASADDIWLRMQAGSPFGRGDILLEAEVKPLGSNFTGSNTTRGGDYMDSVQGAPRLIVPGSLSADTPYHWRLRWHYNPATTPYMPASRWLTVPWNGWNEQDMRTGGDRVYLPLVMRND